MRLLLMMAQAYFPRQAGGVQTVTEHLALAFEALGHQTAVAAELSFRGKAGMASAARLLLGRRGFAAERYKGQAVFRARAVGTKAVAIVDEFRPDCVVVQSMDAMPLAQSVSDRGIPLVVCWHDVCLDRMGGSPSALVARFVANSQFTAGVYEAEFGVQSAVIPPIIRRAHYETTPATERGVTFVNPVADKGVDLAIEIAAGCPEIPFEFVESWILEPAARSALLKRLAALPNVRFTPRQADMRPIYARTRILLAPSQWVEAWGRVASEAHVSGVPVIASRLGGLVESVGPGGILLPSQAPAREWCNAVRSLWSDPALYDDLSAKARAYSRRPELDETWAVGRMLAEIEAAIALRASPVLRPRPAVQSGFATDSGALGEARRG